ncbi:MAG: RNA-binding protein [Gomphosphaeria aponina SAG 52.96 = DSM 107014]|uniref:RNA-binding protein n=1 Tax=Gomphosphaeria aponina SAG 52.96 = DSM 107014 TaxID=1521640 RepID=A0A941GXC7_9CHRO|nr:RNA-binding protein [Gomphosphaeria aponina SAG 52.96 = DSM 107014]
MRERQIQRGQDWLAELLKLMGIPAEVKITQIGGDVGEPNLCWLTIDETNLTPEQKERLIGEKGETIDAIQYLANTILNIGVKPENQGAFTVELDGYRVKREAELFALVEEVAEKVRQTGQEVQLPPLSSAERRQVHTFLQDSEDLATESRGQEPERRVFVRRR